MIIFTDLDGTLLDHSSYSFEAARPALDRIKASGIPLIFATSKTAAELAPLREATGIFQPAIVENGAGIHWPDDGDQDEDTRDYEHIREVVAELRHEGFAYRGFGDMTLEEICEITGLGPDAVNLARQRRYSEPGLFSGDPEQREAFARRLAGLGLTAVQGGRFLTLSHGASKASRVADLCGWWAREMRRERVTSLSLGDAENDIAMLQATDFGVIVANGAHEALRPLDGEEQGRIIRTTQEGPHGWNDAVLDFIERHHEGQQV